MAKQTVTKTTTKKTITIRPKTGSNTNTAKNPVDQPRAANGQFAPRVK